MLFQTGALEGQNAIKHNAHVSISEQQLIDCSLINKGCKGGNMIDSFSDMTTLQIFTEESYPYRASTGKCSTKGKYTGINVDSFFGLIAGENILKNVVGK